MSGIGSRRPNCPSAKAASPRLRSAWTTVETAAHALDDRGFVNLHPHDPVVAGVAQAGQQSAGSAAKSSTLAPGGTNSTIVS